MEKASTERFLESQGVFSSDIQQCLETAPDPIPHSLSISTEEYLTRQNVEVEDIDLKTEEGRREAFAKQQLEELKHQLEARNKVLSALRIPMYVVPAWLIVMLTLPIVNSEYIKAPSERMQLALLTALASDIIGLCYVVTRNLFPQKIADEDLLSK